MLAYVQAVGDTLPIYAKSGLAPPMFCVAQALGQILQRTELPAGAIHSTQEHATLQPVMLGSRLRSLAWLERHREQRGLRVLAFRIDVRDSNEQQVLVIKTTLLVPNSQAVQEIPRSSSSIPDSADIRRPDKIDTLAPVSRKISRDQLSEYAEVSGDHNPLHLDPEFAAGTQFGGIIAHGMLTLAYVNEMMAASLGEAWLSAGSMKARFKGAAYPGDRVETWGRLSKSEGETSTYTVGLSNVETGSQLITGTADVKETSG